MVKRLLLSLVILCVLLVVTLLAILGRPVDRYFLDTLEGHSARSIVLMGDSTLWAIAAVKGEERKMTHEYLQDLLGENVKNMCQASSDIRLWFACVNRRPEVFRGKTVVIEVDLVTYTDQWLNRDVLGQTVYIASLGVDTIGGRVAYRYARWKAQRAEGEGLSDKGKGTGSAYVLPLSPDNPQLTALRQCAELLHELGARAIFYSTPIEHEDCRRMDGPALDEAVTHKLAMVKAVLDGTGAEFLDLTYAADRSLFAHDGYGPTNHLSPDGRKLVAGRIAAAIRAGTNRGEPE